MKVPPQVPFSPYGTPPAAVNPGVGVDNAARLQPANPSQGSVQRLPSWIPPLPRTREKKRKTHQVARTDVNAKLVKMAKQLLELEKVERTVVPDEQVDWEIEVADYRPLVIDLPRGNTPFRKKGDAPHLDEPENVEIISLEGPIKRDKRGYPLNPMGRTGIEGRGMLDKWGPTAAADPVVTRHNPETGRLEALLIEREDTHEWAIPGGKVDLGETPSQAAGRELVEEAGVRGVDLDFSKAKTLDAGYVDDSRNTDNAWMESTVLHLHLNEEQSKNVTVKAGSDATNVKWVEIEKNQQIFASHGEYLKLAQAAVDSADKK